MRISLIGAGRVAHHLALALKQQHDIVNIYSRTFSSAQALAKRIGAVAVETIESMQQEIDLVVIAVSDQAIAQLIQSLHSHFSNVLIVHTSGSTHVNVLSQLHPKSGVFYPLQTFSLEREIDWITTPLFVEAVEAQDLQVLEKVAQQLSQRVYCYDSAQRLSLHLAAVFACNFSNYCYDMAKQVVDAQQVDFSLLYPLILETAKKASAYEPRAVQTGPAMRGDQNILNMHTQMLEQSNRSDLSQVYQLLSEQILKRHQ